MRVVRYSPVLLCLLLSAPAVGAVPVRLDAVTGISTGARIEQLSGLSVTVALPTEGASAAESKAGGGWGEAAGAFGLTFFLLVAAFLLRSRIGIFRAALVTVRGTMALGRAVAQKDEADAEPEQPDHSAFDARVAARLRELQETEPPPAPATDPRRFGRKGL